MPSNKSKKGDQAQTSAAASKGAGNGATPSNTKVQPAEKTKAVSQPTPSQKNHGSLPPLDYRPNSAPPSNPAENEDGTSRERRPSNAEPLGRIRENHWVIEQHVENVHVKFLYQPHTITALGIVMLVVLMVTFTINSDENTMLQNSQTAAWLVAFFVLVLGMLVFPSGPFIRPHPIVWRVVFGVGVLYEVLLLILLSQKRADARAMLTFFYPDLNQPLKERAYADDCSVHWGTLKPAIFDLFFVSHFVGWTLKALMLRDYVLCWSISIEWELIEIFFTHMLPNFAECWWDQWVLDVLLSNGIGIYIGHKLCEYLEFKQYTWGGVESIPTFYGKVKRTVLQFTPERWIHVEWEATSTVKRFIAIQLLILGFHTEELNAFFLKHILWIPPSNPLNVLRLVVWFFIGVPCLRQIYIYITDSTCKRLGAQAWMCVLILVTELCIIFKFSTGLFTNPLPQNVKHGAIAFFVIYFIVSALLLIRGKHQHEHSHGVVTVEDGKKQQ